MSTLYARMAPHRPALPAADLRAALKSLLFRGSWTDPRDGVRYQFADIDQMFRGEMEAPDGSHGYCFRGTNQSAAALAVLKWMFGRIDSDMTIDRDLVVNRKATCPFCWETATCHYSPYEWRACEHFCRDHTEGEPPQHYAYFIVDTEEVRKCWSCGNLTLEAIDACCRCHVLRSHYPESEPRDD